MTITSELEENIRCCSITHKTKVHIMTLHHVQFTGQNNCFICMNIVITFPVNRLKKKIACIGIVSHNTNWLAMHVSMYYILTF